MHMSYCLLNLFLPPSFAGRRGDRQPRRCFLFFFLLSTLVRLFAFPFTIHHFLFQLPATATSNAVRLRSVCCITITHSSTSVLFTVSPPLHPCPNHLAILPPPSPSPHHHLNRHTSVFLLLQCSTDSAATSPSPDPYICICFSLGCSVFFFSFCVGS